MLEGSTKKPRSSSRFHFLAGLSTGILSATLLQPADLLKTRIQQAHSTSLLPTLRGILSGPDAFRNLWRGTLPSVIRTGFGSALYFSTLNGLRQYVAKATNAGHDTTNAAATVALNNVAPASTSTSSSKLPQLSRPANLATGAIARASAGLMLMPVTVIKVRYESSLYAYKSIFGAGKAIYAQNGVRGFFAGSGATAIRDAPYAGLYVVFYEESKRWMSSLAQHAPLIEALEPEQGKSPGEMSARRSVPINFLSGVLAAGVATAVTNPFDAIKTRLQLMPGRYGNMFVAARTMIKEEGWGCLMDGLGLRMGRKAVSSALAWTIYEELVRRAEVGLGDRV